MSMLTDVKDKFQAMKKIKVELDSCLNKEIGRRLRTNGRETPDISDIMRWGNKIDKYMTLMGELETEADKLFRESGDTTGL